jgi:hypothetical protein
MKKLLLFSIIFVFLGCLSTVFSQKIIEIGRNDLKIKKRTFNISAIIDARRDTQSIGMARMGLYNKKEQINFDTALSVKMRQYFQEKMPNDTSLPSVTVRVLRFAVCEGLNDGREIALGSFDFEFYLKKATFYQKIGNLRVRNVEEAAFNVTRYHNYNVRDAMQLTVNYLRDSVNWQNFDQKLVENTFSATDLQTAFLPKILTDTLFKAGVYRNISEFRENAPSRKMQLLQENNKIFILVEKENKPGKFRKLTPSDNIWGASDGFRIYYIESGCFFEMTRKTNGQFQFKGFDVSNEKRKAAYVGSLIGGLTFGIFGSIIGSELGVNLMNPDLKWMQIDLETGNFWMLE